MAAAPAASTEMTLEEMIQDIVEQAVDAHGGNRAAAARQLGISRTTLWRYLNKREERGGRENEVRCKNWQPEWKVLQADKEMRGAHME